MTIKESFYIEYAGKSSKDFKLINAHVDGGLFEETFLSDRQIKEIKVSGNDKTYFQKIEREPLTIPVNLFFEEPWNDELINEISVWLDQDFYQPLSFSSCPEKVFYALCIDTVDIIHAGLEQGYLRLNFRCNSPYAYSRVMESDRHNVNGSLITQLANRGHKPIQPLIYIKKTVSDGQIKIKNMSDRGRELILSNLKLNEEVLIDCENHEIESNLPLTYHYDDHNDIFLNFLRGVNQLEFTGDFEVYFKYQYKLVN